jgi:hypothetical protein
MKRLTIIIGETDDRLQALEVLQYYYEPQEK